MRDRTLISRRSRALLDRYRLAANARARETGERSTREAGQSVEYLDFRPYQPGDELRYVDWKAYARSGRLYTRLHHAERATRLHLLLDVSTSMSVGAKSAYAERLAQLLIYLGQRDGPAQVHLSDGTSGQVSRGLRTVVESWQLIELASRRREAPSPSSAVRRFALDLPARQGAALVVVVSDLFDEEALRPALVALRARGLEAAFLQVLAEEDLDPPVERLQLVDAESRERLEVTGREVHVYRRAVREFVARRRGEILAAGFRHSLLAAPLVAAGELEQRALEALVPTGLLERR